MSTKGKYKAKRGTRNDKRLPLQFWGSVWCSLAVGKRDIHCPRVLQTKLYDTKGFIKSSFRNI